MEFYKDGLNSFLKSHSIYFHFYQKELKLEGKFHKVICYSLFDCLQLQSNNFWWEDVYSVSYFDKHWFSKELHVILLKLLSIKVIIVFNFALVQLTGIFQLYFQSFEFFENNCIQKYFTYITYCHLS